MPSPAQVPSAAFALVASLLVASLSAAPQEIRLGGSDTMVPLVRAFAAAYSRQHPGQKVTVAGLGSERGLAALQAGELDIAAISRPLTDAEREALAKQWGAPPREQVVALDGVGIYLHADNPVTALRIEDLRRILRGELRNWRELGGFDRRIDLYQPDPASGTRRFVHGRLLDGKDVTTNTAVDVLTPAHAVASVSRSLGGIGYATVGYVEGTKVVPLIGVDGGAAIWPDQESVAAGTYPLSRPLLLVCDPGRGATLGKFIDWAAGSDGQQVVDAVGLKRAPKTAAVASIVIGDRVKLHPDSERQHGIGLELVVVEVAGSRTAQRAVTVKLRTLTSGQALPATMVLRLGDDLEVPLAAVDGRVDFMLRRDWLDRAELLLPVKAVGGATRVLVAALVDYVPPK